MFNIIIAITKAEIDNDDGQYDTIHKPLFNEYLSTITKGINNKSGG